MTTAASVSSAPAVRPSGEPRRWFAPLALAAAVAAFAPGCSPEFWVRRPAAREWAYVASQPNDRAPVMDATACVTPLADVRDLSCSRYEWLALIPLVPYGTGTYGDPAYLSGKVSSQYMSEEPWTTPLASAIAEAIAEEIDHAGIFRSCAFEPDPASEYVVSGELRATTVRRTVTLYGLSAFGAMLPMQANHVENHLDVHLALTRRGTGDVLWTHDVRAVASSNWGYVEMLSNRVHEFLFDRALTSAMPQMLQSLEDAVRRLPPRSPE